MSARGPGTRPNGRGTGAGEGFAAPEEGRDPRPADGADPAEDPPPAGEHPAVERHIAVTRTARYWMLGAGRGRPSEAWFVLHGYRQLARRFLRRFEGIAGAGRLVVAPEALSRFYVESEVGRHGPGSVVGATWMTREEREHEIGDYVAYLDAVAREVLDGLGTEPGITVLGFSQGVATASRWVTYGKVRPRRVILWGDYLPPDLDMERASATLGRAELVVVRGTRDRSLSARLEADEAERMEAVGLAARTVTYRGGHDVDEPTLRALLVR